MQHNDWRPTPRDFIMMGLMMFGAGLVGGILLLTLLNL